MEAYSSRSIDCLGLTKNRLSWFRILYEKHQNSCNRLSQQVLLWGMWANSSTNILNIHSSNILYEFLDQTYHHHDWRCFVFLLFLCFGFIFFSAFPLNLLLSAVFLLLLPAAAQSLQGVGALSSLLFFGLFHTAFVMGRASSIVVTWVWFILCILKFVSSVTQRKLRLKVMLSH